MVDTNLTKSEKLELDEILAKERAGTATSADLSRKKQLIGKDLGVQQA